MPIVSMIEQSPFAAIVTNPRLQDNPIIACNRAFERLTGYRKDEIIGRNCRFLARVDSRPVLARQIADAVANRRPLLTELINYRKDGTAFRNAILIVPIFDRTGELIYFLGSQMEAGADSIAAAEPAAAAAKLAGLSRRQREVLTAMIAGHRNKEIGKNLGISERTVKMHRAALIAALGVKTSVDAIRLSIQAGWTG